MKLKLYTLARLANNRIRLDALWTDQMRRPHHITVSFSPVELAVPTPVMEMDAGDLFKLLSGFATIAWDMGWRPQGLATAVSNVVTSFKPARD